MATYKVVETSVVSDEELEKILNRYTREGWQFDSFHFVTRENSRRPGMAFILFSRRADAEDRTSTGTDTTQEAEEGYQ